MDRREQLRALVDSDSLELVTEIIDKIVFLEGKMEELQQLPFIRVHPDDASKQRPTPAAKMYKEFLQQYINCVKAVEYVIYRDRRAEPGETEESPLREWFKRHAGEGTYGMDSG